MYADDSTFYYAAKTISELDNVLSAELNKVFFLKNQTNYLGIESITVIHTKDEFPLVWGTYRTRR